MSMPRTKSGAIDRRSREYREGRARMSAGEVEQMLDLILPAVRIAAKRYEEATKRIAEFRATHPELAEMETEAGNAMAANNEAVLPLWGLLRMLEAAGDYDRWRAWCDYLNGDGPHPREARRESA